MNRNGQTIEKTAWWRIGILGALILVTWVLALVFLPKLGRGGLAPSSPTPTQVSVPSSTAKATLGATAPSTATAAPTSTAVSTVAAATATAASTAPVEAYCLTTVDQLNVRSGPGTTYSVLLQLQSNERVTPVARNGDGTWIQAIVRGNVQGWISASYLACQGVNIANLPVVAVFPTPTQTAALPTNTPISPTSSPPVFRYWRGEYYGNNSLSGPVLLLRDDVDISFDWSSGSPSANVPGDNWSARWTRDLNLSAGLYRLQVRVDDGVRVWVDGRLLIDQWRPGVATYSAETYLSGDRHNLKVEYVEYSGNALIFVSWQRVEPTYRNWRGEYYGNPDLAGTPVVLRDDQAVNFDWGYRSPAPGVPTDRFSARWTQRVSFSEGRYRFRVEADDGVRLWVAGNLIIDRWHGGSSVSTVDQRIWTGTHEVVLEYFELEGIAKAKLSWEKLNAGRTPTATPPTRTPVITEWRAEYFDNDNLQGSPRVVRNEREISFDWRTNAPVSGVGKDHFSARFTRQLDLPAGIYRWSAAADDGVRVYIDNQPIIDEWREGPLTEHVRQVSLAAGIHIVRIEYMESTGFAALYVHWERLASTVTPTQTLAPPTVTPSATALPPTATATGTAVPPTATPTRVSPTATETAILPTATPTMIPATATETAIPPTATPTSAPPTATPTQEPTVTNTPTSIPPTATPTVPAGAAVPYRTLLQGNQSFKFVRQTAYKVFASKLAWDNWVAEQGGEPVTLPGVDWGDEAVIAVFLDPQLDINPDGSTVGVTVSSVRSSEGSVLVEVALRNIPPADRRPGIGVRPKDGATAPRPNPGTPYHIVAMSRAGLPSNVGIPVYFTDVRGQVVGRDTLASGAGLESGPEIPPGIRRSKEPF